MGGPGEITGAVARKQEWVRGANSRRLPAWLVGPSKWARLPTGALIIGGDYRALGTVRSLGRHKIPVWVITDDHLIASISRYARKVFSWPAGDEREQIDFLLDLNKRHNLEGWVLFASSDETAATVARYHAELAKRFRVTIPPWETLKWAYDKRLTYHLADRLGIDYPWTCIPNSREQLARAPCTFPAILKPAVKPAMNPFTVAKAWRVDDRQSLLTNYDIACTMVDRNAILLQELIPGGSEEQFSYAALCLEGQPLASVVARRSRQYPTDFGRSSTFVETVEQREVEQLGRDIVGGMRFTGVVEVEFKRDPRTDAFKLLDINPRIWGWHTLGQRAGVDFSYLLWRVTQREFVSSARGRAGVGWRRMSTDLPAAIKEIWSGRLSVFDYLRSLRGSVESAIFASDDPLPGLLEIPLSAYLIVKRRWV
jgi:D-aspartate ligase